MKCFFIEYSQRSITVHSICVSPTFYPHSQATTVRYQGFFLPESYVCLDLPKTFEHADDPTDKRNNTCSHRQVFTCDPVGISHDPALGPSRFSVNPDPIHHRQPQARMVLTGCRLAMCCPGLSSVFGVVVLQWGLSGSERLNPQGHMFTSHLIQPQLFTL